MEIDFKKLTEPFADDLIEWRCLQCGRKGDGKVWAKLAPYLDARTVQERFDQVCGQDGWKDEYTIVNAYNGDSKVSGFISRITIGDVYKEDGAELTGSLSPIKGGISDAFKRASVKWGVGRELYGLGVIWAKDIKEGYAPAGVKSVSLENKKDNIKAWCPTPKLYSESTGEGYPDET